MSLAQLPFSHNCDCYCHSAGFLTRRESCFRGCIDCDEQSLSFAQIEADPVRSAHNRCEDSLMRAFEHFEIEEASLT
mgnify:CR=1 FL=1